ncbi:hypothetical protein BCR36DRAFT_583463, partial [Piromyces finnis]
MNNQGFQGFGTTPPSQTQVYPDGTVRIVQNTNQMIAAPTIAQSSQEQHPHQHPQIIQNSMVSNKVQSQAVYYSRGQGQQTVIMKSNLGNTAITTPPMSFNSTIYSSQGQNQGQQGISIYSASPMNIQIASTPPNGPVNSLRNDGANAVMMAQQNGVINEMTSYTVAQPIQTQEAKSYNNPIFVLPSPSTPTPQMSYTTSTNSQSTIVQVQQTPPQNTAQYMISQKQGQAMNTQQMIFQGPPTPYGTSPTTTQVQVLAQSGNTAEVMSGSYGNTSIISPTQIQYQYSVTPPLTNDKDIQMKQEGKVSPEMSIGGSDKLGSQDSSVPVDLNGQGQEKGNSTMTKESLSTAGPEKDKLERQEAISQDNEKSQSTAKEEPILMDTADTKDNNMNIDSTESKIKVESNEMNNITVMTTMNNTSIVTTLDPSAMMTQTLANPQDMTATPNNLMQATHVDGNTQNMNMISGVNPMPNVGVNVGIEPVNKINIINGINNNVNYIPANMNIQGATTPANVNISGINTIQGVQVATAIPQTINTIHNMNIMNGNGNNIISISPTQQTIPLNTNSSINLYYNQGQNVMNGTSNTIVNYANANTNIMKPNATKNSNGYNARTKNSHIVDPDVPIEVLIKRRKNTEAARRSRLRKAERIQVLTEIVHNLEEKN